MTNNPYDGWNAQDERDQREYNATKLFRWLATDELVAELNRRGFDVSYTHPELGTQVVKV